MGNKHAGNPSQVSLCKFESSDSNKFTDNLIFLANQRDIEKYYDIQCKLSQGSMGTISKAIRRKEKEGGSAYSNKPAKRIGGAMLKRPTSVKVSKEFAIKSIVQSRISPEFVKELWNEIEILQKLDHPNVVKAYEIYGSKRNIHIVMEFCSGGDLYKRIPYSEKQAAKIVGKLLSAIAYMHEKGIVHRDIKFENLMFESEAEDAEIKLLDFGLSKKFKDGKLRPMSEGVGTIYTMAPEVINGAYNSQADLWSVGVMTYMLLTSIRPFNHKNRSKMVMAIKKCDYSFNQNIWQTISPEAKEFVSQLIVLDPNTRLTAKMALHHDWQRKQFDLSERAVDEVVMKQVSTNLKQYASVSEFKKMALMVIAHQSNTEDILVLRKAFDQCDTSNIGKITLQEFKNVIENSGSHYPEGEIERLFSKIDVAENNEIEYSEFLAATLEAQGAIEEEKLAQAFDRIDCDDSGFICRQNLKNMLGESCKESQINEIISEADEDNNGQISFQEFMKSFRKHSTCMRENFV